MIFWLYFPHSTIDYVEMYKSESNGTLTFDPALTFISVGVDLLGMTPAANAGVLQRIVDGLCGPATFNVQEDGVFEQFQIDLGLASCYEQAKIGSQPRVD